MKDEKVWKIEGRYMVFTSRRKDLWGLDQCERSFDDKGEMWAYCEYLEKIGMDYQLLDCNSGKAVLEFE